MIYLAGIQRFLFSAAALASAFLIAGGQSAAQSGNRESVLERLRQDDLRVAALGWRLVTANADRCLRQMPGTGLILHSANQYQGAWHSPAIRVHGTIGSVSIEGIVPRSPAKLAGAESGDELTAINGQQLEPGGDTSKGATFRRDQAEYRLIGLSPHDPIRLSLVRAGKEQDLVVHPVPACRARFEVVAGSARFARSNGTLIQLGQALASMLSEEELAFVLSHELAHSILDHRTRLAELERQVPRRQAGSRYRVLAREYEDQADRLAVHLLARAGFDPWAAPRFMRKHGVSFDQTSTRAGTHRPAEQRAALMEAEIARLEAASGG